MQAIKKLFLVRLLHTFIWVFFASLVFYILWCGIFNQITFFTWIAIALVIGEALVLLTFRWACPLTLIARRYSDSTRHNFDIFLPEWLAKHNKTIFTSLYLVGVVLVLWREFGS